jgi:malonate decarboxylase beta subunit
MGLIARCADHVVMSDVGRLAMSGPEVIESSHGVEEYDSRDRALVWRTTGGKHRYLIGDCDPLVEDDVAAFRESAIGLLGQSLPLSLETMEAEHALLLNRLNNYGDCRDALEIWRRMGIPDPMKVADLEASDMHALKASQIKELA